jgi:hypothetical protein
VNPPAGMIFSRKSCAGRNPRRGFFLLLDYARGILNPFRVVMVYIHIIPNNPIELITPFRGQDFS